MMASSAAASEMSAVVNKVQLPNYMISTSTRDMAVGGVPAAS